MKVGVIINPAAGKPTPILHILSDFFIRQGWIPEMMITQQVGHAEELTQQVLSDSPDAVAVYGGDGTVMEAAQALIGSNTPLLVIPGGTANVVAKELGIPLDHGQALQLLKQGAHLDLDTFTANSTRGFMRLSQGIFADAVIAAEREQKQTLGLFAYTVEAIKTLMNPRNHQYTLTIDQTTIKTTGIGIMVTNLASVGLSTLKFHQQINPTDQLLDVIVLKSFSPEVIQSVTSQVVWTPQAQSVDHFQGSKISLHFNSQQQLLIDDKVDSVESVTLKLTDKKLRVIAAPDYVTQNHLQ